MVDNIDQFGRDTSKNISSSLNEEKSKKILDSLAEIKNQLEKKLDGELSIFHKLDDQSSIQQNKSLLVLENEGDFNRSNFNLFRFIMTINFLTIVLIGLIVYIKDIPIKDIISIF